MNFSHNDDDRDHCHPYEIDDGEGINLDIEVESTNPLELDGKFNIRELFRLLHNKVDKIKGKGLSSNDFTDAYKNKLDNLNNPDMSGYVPKTTKVNNHPLTGDINITKGDVGLGNVDNTSDLNKPISNATQSALNDKEPTLTKGDIVELNSSVLEITGGQDAIIGTGVTIEVKEASETQSGYITAEDYRNFSSIKEYPTYREIFIMQEGQTTVTLDHAPREDKEVVNVNGLIAYPGVEFDYVVQNNLLIFNYPLNADEEVMIVYS